MYVINKLSYQGIQDSILMIKPQDLSSSVHVSMCLSFLHFPHCPYLGFHDSGHAMNDSKCKLYTTIYLNSSWFQGAWNLTFEIGERKYADFANGKRIVRQERMRYRPIHSKRAVTAQEAYPTPGLPVLCITVRCLNTVMQCLRNTYRSNLYFGKNLDSIQV